jgi:hypothetical protein
MTFRKAEKPAVAPATNGLPNCEQLGGPLTFDATGSCLRFQRLIRLFALPTPHAGFRRAEAIFDTVGDARQAQGFVAHCPVPPHGRGHGGHDPSIEVREGMRAPVRRPLNGEPNDEVPF